MKPRTLSKKELEIVESQLGRVPRGARGIVKICSKGKPVVILTAPMLSDGAVFPTCFWLTCPILSKKVGKLESEGQIKVLQRLLARNKGLSDKMKKAHLDYQRLRQNLLSLSGRQALSLNKKETIKKTGVGGTFDLTKIKCLHAHYAHWLATGKNPVGEAVHSRVGKPECKKECGSS